jgi:AP2 domain
MRGSAVVAADKPNRYRRAIMTPFSSYRIIPLSRGYHTIVDREDYDLLRQYRWFAKISTNTGRVYAWRHTKKVNGRSKVVYMHREILGLTPGDGLQGDHISIERTLDNRRSNLRVATASQNKMNAAMRADNTSGYRGVCFHKPNGKWIAEIAAGGKRHYLGIFPTPALAHAAYCEAAKTLHGAFSRPSKRRTRNGKGITG